MKTHTHNPNTCPWCGKQVTRPLLDLEAGAGLDFICEECGDLIRFCGVDCWRRAYIALFKAEGLTGKQARQKLMDYW
ncbi:unnamed protein product [marine sediment metagenome]|uniref:Uncharacterized protein n=1 Tax=marine sediment metagenome TaxID=412755 RepID=X1SLH5_9ZZZZ